jgi:arylsulfatase A
MNPSSNIKALTFGRLIIVFGLLLVMSRTAAAVDRQPTKLPNFVIILADELGWGDLGCYGHPIWMRINNATIL